MLLFMTCCAQDSHALFEVPGWQPLHCRRAAWLSSALQRRCLTDTLMEVPSEQDYGLRRRGSSVRKEIFELVRLHLRKLTFPEADGNFFCHACLSLTGLQKPS